MREEAPEGVERARECRLARHLVHAGKLVHLGACRIAEQYAQIAVDNVVPVDVARLVDEHRVGRKLERLLWVRLQAIRVPMTCFTGYS